MRSNLFPTLASAACLLVARSAAVPPFAATFETVYSFTGSYSNSGPDGANPGGHIVAKDGIVYGATSYGGNGGGNAGTLFAFNTKTGTEAPIFSFDSSPDGYEPLGVTIDANYLLYATYGGLDESDGGYAPAAAVIGRFNLKTGENSTLSTFPNGGPAGGVAYKGLIYGALNSGGANGCGALFSVNPKTGEQTDLYDFTGQGPDGCDPQYGLVNVNGVLYGASGTPAGAYGAGVIFSYTIATKQFSAVYQFPADAFGNTPNGNNPGLLMVGDGVIYGAASAGGTGNNGGYGTFFSFNPVTNKFNVLYKFTGGAKDGAYPTLNAYANNTLIGQSSNTSSGTTQIIYFHIKTGEVVIRHRFTAAEGYGSDSNFVLVGGSYYGTTDTGGTHNVGTIFRFTP